MLALLFAMANGVDPSPSFPPNFSPPPPPPSPTPPFPPPTCGQGWRQAANGCSLCGPGTYQDQPDWTETSCTACPNAMYMQDEGAAECMPCWKPICALAVDTCNPISGLEQTFVQYDSFTAITIECGPNGTEPGVLSESDACQAPHYCMLGIVQCNAEPRRYPMRLVGPGGLNDANQFWMPMPADPDWGVLSACPHLRREDGAMRAACWDQYVPLSDAAVGGWLVGGDNARKSSELLYSPYAVEHTAIVPGSFTASCNNLPVEPRYQFFFVACLPNSTECSDELIDCPSSSDLRAHGAGATTYGQWWLGMGVETLASSALSTARRYTASLAGMAQRTVHTIVHIWEPQGSAHGPSSMICLSRTKLDDTPPMLGNVGSPFPLTLPPHPSSAPFTLHPSRSPFSLNSSPSPFTLTLHAHPSCSPFTLNPSPSPFTLTLHPHRQSSPPAHPRPNLHLNSDARQCMERGGSLPYL